MTRVLHFFSKTKNTGFYFAAQFFFFRFLLFYFHVKIRHRATNIRSGKFNQIKV